MSEKNLQYCKFCGDGVHEEELREHLELHNADAKDLQEADVKKEFTCF